MSYVARALPPVGVTGFHLIYFPGGCFTAGLAFISILLAGVSLLGLLAYAVDRDPEADHLVIVAAFGAFPALIGLHGLVMGIAWIFKSDADWEKVMKARDRRESESAR
jgi:hypothetical protein